MCVSVMRGHVEFTSKIFDFAIDNHVINAEMVADFFIITTSMCSKQSESSLRATFSFFVL